MGKELDSFCDFFFFLLQEEPRGRKEKSESAGEVQSHRIIIAEVKDNKEQAGKPGKLLATMWEKSGG
jgi:hypothetical protein